MSKGNIRWTEKQKEVARLSNEGKSFAEIVAMDYSNGLVSKVMKALKEGNSPTQNQIDHKNGDTPTSKTQKIGEILIAPQNWILNPKGALLILDTYERAKEELDYGGTVTDFLCDITTIFRRWLGYNMEVQHGREITGGGVAEVSSKESATEQS